MLTKVAIVLTGTAFLPEAKAYYDYFSPKRPCVGPAACVKSWFPIPPMGSIVTGMCILCPTWCGSMRPGVLGLSRWLHLFFGGGRNSLI